MRERKCFPYAWRSAPKKSPACPCIGSHYHCKMQVLFCLTLLSFVLLVKFHLIILTFRLSPLRSNMVKCFLHVNCRVHGFVVFVVVHNKLFISTLVQISCTDRQIFQSECGTKWMATQALLYKDFELYTCMYKAFLVI